MAHESFEDPEVAALMNEVLINIKVDREERPDIDSLYMTVCQMITGSGGWPLTIIMDAEKRPFTAGTYFPKKSHFGRIGMLELIPRIKQYWVHNREQLYHASMEVLDQLQNIFSLPMAGLGAEVFAEAFHEAQLLFDNTFGGFGHAPKFPTPHKLLFLLRYWKRTGEKRALAMVEKTLQAMRFGGIYDHIGFGFHRYATDNKWLVPHFEKMLYDQALLLIAYTEAFQATKNPFYKQVAYEIAEYVLRDLTAPGGGFYSAEDADSERQEGKFYTWTMNEIKKVLGSDAALFIEIFNLTKEGNFEIEVSKERNGTNIPHLMKDLSILEKKYSIPKNELKKMIDVFRNKLFRVREERIHPHKDDKILTDWNSLMIAAFSIAGRVFDEPRFTNAAKAAGEFILKTFTTTDGRLFHRYREGDVAIKGLVNDYSFLIWALLELYQTTFETKFLQNALFLNQQLIKHFWDNTNGGFYFTPDDGEKLLIRKKEIYDGAIPSGNSVVMLNLLKIARITGDLSFEEMALQINKTFATQIGQSLLAHTMFLNALEYAFGQSFEIVIVGIKGARDTAAMIRAIHTQFIPNKILLFVPKGAEEEILQITDFVANKKMEDNKAMAYVCVNRFCKFPTTDISKMLDFFT